MTTIAAVLLDEQPTTPEAAAALAMATAHCGDTRCEDGLTACQGCHGHGVVNRKKDGTTHAYKWGNPDVSKFTWAILHPDCNGTGQVACGCRDLDEAQEILLLGQQGLPGLDVPDAPVQLAAALPVAAPEPAVDNAGTLLLAVETWNPPTPDDEPGPPDPIQLAAPVPTPDECGSTAVLDDDDDADDQDDDPDADDLTGGLLGDLDDF